MAQGNQVRLWDVETDRFVRSFPHTDSAMSVAASPDGRYFIVTCEFSGDLIKVDTVRQEIIGQQHLLGPEPPPGTHRWTRHRAWLRLLPATTAPAYDLTLWMGSPFPSTLASPEVALRIGSGEPSRVTLDREVKPYRLRAAVAAGRPLIVRLDAPTWSRAGEPADQGVRVDRMTVSPSVSGP